MEGPELRVERTPTGRRVLWPPLRRRHDVDIALPLHAVEDLFATPSLDPFKPDWRRSS